MFENPYLPIVVSLGVGLLVGLQREWSASGIAGIRSFALITLLGTVMSMLPAPLDGVGVGAGTIGVAIILWVANRAKLETGGTGSGITTEIAALMMFAVGAAIGAGLIELAIVVSGIVAVLLHWKAPLHDFANRIGAEDFRAIIQFVLITLVILPILPDEQMGPYGVLNPFHVWLMVVLVVGISLAAYVTYKLMGAKTGSILGGALGGLISSTATTFSFARLSREKPEASRFAALVIMTSAAVVNLRLLAQIAAVGPAFLSTAAAPILILFAVMTALSLAMAFWLRGESISDGAQSNPAQLRTALIVGALYAGVLLAAAATKEHFGERGIYVVAGISGLVDLNAITMSVAELSSEGRIAPQVGWRSILMATIANLLFKIVAVAVWGSRRTAAILTLLFGVCAAVAIALILFW